METVISAIIGGVFSLLGVWLGSYLQNRRAERIRVRLSPEKIGAREENVTVGLAVGGLALFFSNILLIVIIVNVFDFVHVHPWWENEFWALTFGVIPILAVILAVRGIIRLFAKPKQQSN